MNSVDPRMLLTPREQVWYPYRLLPNGVMLVAHFAFWVINGASWAFFCSLVGWFLLTSVPRWYFKSRIASVTKDAWERTGVDVSQYGYGLSVAINNMLMIMGPLAGIALLYLAYAVL